jgi:phosphoribosyl-ATP pyrophosphohydrolase/phosphoribosyl-AMP cyclohydrolase
MTASMEFIQQLEETIRQRAAADTGSSYTARLLDAGTKRISQKVGEEGVEVALAAVAGSQEELLEEAADLLYHLLVLLHARDASLSDVVQVLETRHR